MKKFIVYFACDKENLEFTEWQTIDGLDEIEAESAEEAASIASYTDGFEDAFFKVFELFGKDEFGNTIKSDESEIYSF